MALNTCCKLVCKESLPEAIEGKSKNPLKGKRMVYNLLYILYMFRSSFFKLEKVFIVVTISTLDGFHVLIFPVIFIIWFRQYSPTAFRMRHKLL